MTSQVCAAASSIIFVEFHSCHYIPYPKLCVFLRGGTTFVHVDHVSCTVLLPLSKGPLVCISFSVSVSKGMHLHALPEMETVAVWPSARLQSGVCLFSSDLLCYRQDGTSWSVRRRYCVKTQRAWSRTTEGKSHTSQVRMQKVSQSLFSGTTLVRTNGNTLSHCSSHRCCSLFF